MRHKVLTLCGYGNVRSVCLSRQLKDWYDQEALTAGLVANSPETLRMLFDWADYVLNTCELNPGEYLGSEDYPKEKFYDFNVGKDRWGEPSNPELVAIMIQKIEASGLFPTRRIV